MVDMNLIINFTKSRGEIGLRLKRSRVCIDTLTFDFDANLDSVLISAVDKILKRNKIETLSLKTVKIGGNIDKNSSAHKVALAFCEAWKKAHKW